MPATQSFAYNRVRLRDRATAVQREVLKQNGPSLETCGLLRKIPKDIWIEATKANRQALARGHLDREIDLHRMGFEADPRDTYPEINVLTLLEIRGGDESIAEKSQLLPVVRYAVERRFKTASPDCWDHAMTLELAILADNRIDVQKSLGRALASVRERWKPESHFRHFV